MPSDPSGKAEREEPPGTASDVPGQGEAQPPAEVTGDGPRAFRIGDRVRAVNARLLFFGRTGTIERVSPTDPAKFSVDFPRQRDLIRFLPADLQFDIQREVGRLFPLLVKRHPALSFLASDAVTVRTLRPGDWAGMKIDVPPSYVTRVWQEVAGIPLRYTRDPGVKKLLIGCGNTPTKQWKILNGAHPIHGTGVYTLAPDIQLGPSVLGLFGHDPVHAAFLPGNFLLVDFEGYTPLPDAAALDAQPYFLDGLDHLLADQGIVRFPVGPRAGTRTVWAKKEGRRLLVTGETPGNLPTSPPEWVGREVTLTWLRSELQRWG
ncbi:hypothetical protein ACRYCC_20595 [Actinomadura scrupuli]|uniref:hypothetical protein n=1 Tax=Actinomadura scrupuli TaxID=559629 RepID=UPI003D960BAC